MFYIAHKIKMPKSTKLIKGYSVILTNYSLPYISHIIRHPMQQVTVPHSTVRKRAINMSGG
jgi:hypothetical protein